MFALVNKPKPQDVGRKIIKVAVTATGKDAIQVVADRYGMKEQAVAGRIYEWFFRQDSIVQRVILGLLDGLEVDAAKRFMERLAGEDDRPVKAAPPIGREGSVRRHETSDGNGDGTSHSTHLRCDQSPCSERVGERK